MNEEDRFIRTTIRMTLYDHRVLRAVCALTGETMSEFITRAAKAELSKLLIEKKDEIDRMLGAKKEHDEPDSADTVKLKALQD